ncbi:exo-1,4-beta-D-glucosaminidase [bacterium A37T11]|nr:exo-1,4-beta-D-glucosaminidase [bacterium A37T11]
MNLRNSFRIYFVLTPIFFLGCRNTNQRFISDETLQRGWRIASSKTVGLSASSLNQNDSSWIPAQVPGTVFGSLTEAGVYPDPFAGKRLDSISPEPFKVPWWYKNTFRLDHFDPASENLALQLEGINYRASIWLNGKPVANQDSLFGAYKQFSLDISSLAKAGDNQLLILVSPPQVRDFYMGFVDWAPTPPDHFMGIFRDVRLKRSGKVSLTNICVNAAPNLPDTTMASVSISMELHNRSNQPKEVTVSLTIGGEVHLENNVRLAAREQRMVAINAGNSPSLTLRHPRLWWPNGSGSPHLYRAKVKIIGNDGTLLDSSSVKFGVRKIDTYLSKEGVRRYKINGKDILIKGAGWVDDLLLRYQPAKDSAQISYVKDMNLNAIRMEGVWGNNQHIYDLCDENGILVMVGWSCQWEWPDYLGLPLNMKAGDENLPINEGVDRYAIKLQSSEKDLLATYLRDQVKWLRNHPGIFTWVVGSDAMPPADLEQRYHDTLKKYDPSRPLLISTGEFTSTVSGPSGMKMNGPYQYVPPVYWYEDKKLGGAFGFNSETGPGPQIPPLKSIQKMIPAGQRWPADNPMWNYHSGRKDFANMSIYLEALNRRYGTSPDLATLAFRAQLLNYEAIRPMFEAHVLHQKQTGGVIQWMLNSPWPEFYWQLYDYYLMPTGAYYGTKKALQPLNLIYNYQDQQIYASNSTQHNINEHFAIISLYDGQSHILYQQKFELALASGQVKALATPPLPQTKGQVSFLDLRIFNKQGHQTSQNFYWLATQMDQLDWSVYSWFYTPSKHYADFAPLLQLPKVKLAVKARILSDNNQGAEAEIQLYNPSSYISFFNELQLFYQTKNDNILPVIWEDNYFSILPNEHKTIRVKYNYNGKKPVIIQLQALNGPPQQLIVLP